MDQCKLIFAGPVGVGKTTAVAALCHGRLLTTEEDASDVTRLHKDTTTVAFDYGVIDLDGGDRLHVYGLPGQKRFDFMWEILAKDSLGLILLLDNSRSSPCADLKFYVDAFRGFIEQTGLVVGVTRTDSHPLPVLDTYRASLAALGFKSCPVFEVDPRMRENVVMMVQALLYQLAPELAG
ncbi:GTP-binding protein [Chitiniphilus shinanonensis]|uniref:GTP-binding protein n=1 Tax=Chitiniphilus shinanonensis TaxID=553088 RepID=A0ABQ6BVK8_9NEIS|nr:ATP/GTP-binding protein [Chitiniphilus shinanonensis]GLS05758.1 GTP-binding protein [Chitiniphilus shinanonensis]